MLRAFNEKYGPPHEKLTKELQNNAGASFTNITAIWDTDCGYLKVEKYGSTDTNGGAEIRSEKLQAMMDKHKARKAKKAAGDL